MSPEIETLDQLLGGEMPLSAIRQLYPDQSGFEGEMLGLLVVATFACSIELARFRSGSGGTPFDAYEPLYAIHYSARNNHVCQHWSCGDAPDFTTTARR